MFCRRTNATYPAQALPGAAGDAMADHLHPDSIPPLLNRKKRRFERFRRANRKLRDQARQYRRLSIATACLAVALAFLAGFALFEEAKPEPILLGTGQAGVMGLDTTATDSAAIAARTPAAPPADVAAPEPSVEDAPADAIEGPGRAIGEGEASYYAEELAGSPTASGEAFDPGKLTAAHRTLPLGTRVRVTNVRSGESVVVRINDRGPFSGHRVIDLSKAAARQIGLLSAGTGRVRLEVLA